MKRRVQWSGVAIRVTDLVKEYEVYQKPLDVALEV